MPPAKPGDVLPEQRSGAREQRSGVAERGGSLYARDMSARNRSWASSRAPRRERAAATSLLHARHRRYAYWPWHDRSRVEERLLGAHPRRMAPH